MTIPVIAIRAEPGLSETVRKGKALGLDMVGLAGFNVEPVEWQPPEPGEYDALLIGSANVFREGGEALNAVRDLPVIAVGSATAEAAKEAGFTVETVGEKGLQQLVQSLPETPRKLLRLAGQEHVVLRRPDHLQIDRQVIYRVSTLPLDLTEPETMAVVLVHAGGAGQHLREEVDRLGLPRSKFAIAAIAYRAGVHAGFNWAAIRHPEKPNEEALLELAREMCQTLASEGQ